MRLTSPGVLLVLLLLSACGGEPNQFAEDYNRAVRPLAELGANVEGSAQDFERLARGTDRTRRRLARLEAPEGAAGELDALLRRLDASSRDLSRVADATRSKDPVRQERASERLEESTKALRDAEDALKDAVEDASG